MESIPLAAERNTLIEGQRQRDRPANDDDLPGRAHFGVTWRADPGRFQLTAFSRAVRLNGAHTTQAPLATGDVIRAAETVFVYVDDDPMTEVHRRAHIVAKSSLSILITGETGTGKEVLARSIHGSSGRSGPFVPVNCGAIPRDLFAAELFGHVRGAFSGAVQSRKGWIGASDGGTLLLDEMGDMPPEQQCGLLRVVESRTIAPVGADREFPVDLRIISATNRDLRGMAAAGAFRGDLLARLAQVTIHIPPLRQRKTEILILARRFATECQSPLVLDAGAAEALLLYGWPYNVRELRSTVAALALFGGDAATISLSHLREVLPGIGAAPLFSPGPIGAGLRVVPPESATAIRARGMSTSVLRDAHLLKESLADVDGNIAALARRLGTSRTHVYRWLRRWGVARD